MEEKKIDPKEGSSENFKSYLNRDPLLAFLWKYQDPSLWLKCFNPLGTLNLSYLNTKKEMKEFKLKRDQLLTLFFIPFPLFDLELDLRLVLESNHRILFEYLNSDKFHLFKILNILESINRLTWKDLLNVFEFRIIDGIPNHSRVRNTLLEEFKSSRARNFPIYYKT